MVTNSLQDGIQLGIRSEQAYRPLVHLVIPEADGYSAFDVCVVEQFVALRPKFTNAKILIFQHLLIPCFRRTASVRQEPCWVNHFHHTRNRIRTIQE